MRITFIGSGTGVPSLRRASPCILVDAGAVRILFDTGPGTLRQLLRTGTALNDIDILAYSHFHIDHTGDMIPFVFASKYSPGISRNRDLTIVGHHGLHRLYQDLVKAYGTWAAPEHFAIRWLEVESDRLSLGDCTLLTAPVDHLGSSIAYRLEGACGRSLVYSGDTDYSRSLVKLAECADVLIIECSFPEGMKRAGHLVPSLAGKIARESRCAKLILTHFYPPCEESDLLTPLMKEYDGEVILAEDLMEIEV